MTATTEQRHPLESESVNEFEVRIASTELEAKGTGDIGTLEAGSHIFKIINRQGLNGAKYFIYKNVKVFPIGKTEEIEGLESTSLLERLHGTDGGVVEGYK